MNGLFRPVLCRSPADVLSCLHAGRIDWDGRHRPGLPTHQRTFTLGPSKAPEAALGVELCVTEGAEPSPWGLRLRLGGPMRASGALGTWTWLKSALETSCSLFRPTWAALTTRSWPLEQLEADRPRVGAITYCARPDIVARAGAHAAAVPFQSGHLLFPTCAAEAWTGVTDAEIATVQRALHGRRDEAVPTPQPAPILDGPPPASPWIAWASYAAGSGPPPSASAAPAPDLDGTALLQPFAVMGAALPFVAGAPAAALRSIEERAEPLPAPAARGDDDLDETAPLGIRTLADRAPALPWAEPRRFRSWTLEQYASLCAELAERPEGAIETGRRYRVEEHAAMRQLNLEFAARFRSEASLLSRWRQLVEAYRTELRSRRDR